ncbi:MAG: MFS transporter [Chloroflexi bacterium]|nr:MFS transporter [Chloroflexota bacterium]
MSIIKLDWVTVRRLWINRDYLLLWGGQLTSATGSQVSFIAVPLLILAVTRSPAQAGLVGALGSLTSLLLGLPAGAFVDRWDRKRAMLICDACRCLNMASVPLVAAVWRLTIVQLALVSIVEGALFVVFSAAEAAALPRVVPGEQLPAAAALNLAADRLARLLGPPLGGILYSYRLSLIPDELQGRVNSVARLISFGGQPLSLALTGVLLQTIGLYPTILFIAACLLALAVVVTLHRGLRQAPRLLDTGRVTTRRG